MKIVWTEKSSSDLLGIYDFIAKQSEVYAESVYHKLLNRPIPQLLDHPNSGSVVPEFERDDIREVFLYSFRLIYLVLPSEIRILTVIHGSQDLTFEPNEMA